MELSLILKIAKIAAIVIAVLIILLILRLKKKQSMKRVAAGTAATFLAFIAALLLTRPIVSAFGGGILAFFLSSLPKDVSSSQFIPQAASSLYVALASIIAFPFVVLIFDIILALISGLLVPKSENDKRSLPVTIIGSVICAAVLIFSFVFPAYAGIVSFGEDINGIYGSDAPAVKKIREAASENINLEKEDIEALAARRKGPTVILYDILGKVSFYDYESTLHEEVLSLCNTAAGILNEAPESLELGYTTETIDFVYNSIGKIFDLKMPSTLATSLINSCCTAWDSGKEWAGIEMPDLGMAASASKRAVNELKNASSDKVMTILSGYYGILRTAAAVNFTGDSINGTDMVSALNDEDNLRAIFESVNSDNKEIVTEAIQEALGDLVPDTNAFVTSLIDSISEVEADAIDSELAYTSEALAILAPLTSGEGKISTSDVTKLADLSIQSETVANTISGYAEASTGITLGASEQKDAEASPRAYYENAADKDAAAASLNSIAKILNLKGVKF